MNGVLPELPSGSPQALTPDQPYCDDCGEPCCADDFSQVASLFICTLCIETQLQAVIQ